LIKSEKFNNFTYKKIIMMRKIPILLFAAMFSVTIAAQDMWLGGSLGLSGVSSDAQTQSNISLAPELGFNLTDEWAVGGRLGFSTERTTINDNTQSINATSVIPFVRYNFGHAGNFNLFAQAELPLRFYGGTNFDGSSRRSTNAIGFAARPGVSYNFNDTWGFQMLMPSIFSLNDHDGVTSYSLVLNRGYTIQDYILDTSIGFIYMF
jgi:hypothetical protein